MKELETLYQELVKYGTIIHCKECENFVGEPIKQIIFGISNRKYYFVKRSDEIVDFSFKIEVQNYGNY